MDQLDKKKLLTAITYILGVIAAAILGFFIGCSVVKDGDNWQVDVLFPRHKIAIDIEPDSKPAPLERP